MRPSFLCASMSALSLVAGAALADDRTMASEVLSTLDPAFVDDSVKQAKDALERGTRMRNAGNAEHARLAEGLALEWAGVARDRAKMAAAEKEARAVERKAIDEAAHVERERALLEEAIARSGRLRAELAVLKAQRAAGKGEGRAVTSGAAEAKSPPKHAQAEGADAPASDRPKKAPR
jgi:hypothetical protein